MRMKNLKTKKTFTDYLAMIKQVRQFIPIEIVTLYLAIENIIKNEIGNENIAMTKLVLTITAGLCFVLSFVYPKHILKITDNAKVVIGSVSFLIWVCALGTLSTMWEIHNGTIVGVVLMLWLTVVNWIYNKTQV